MRGSPPLPIPPLLNETCVSLNTQNYSVMFNSSLTTVCSISAGTVQNADMYRKIMIIFIILFSGSVIILCALCLSRCREPTTPSKYNISEDMVPHEEPSHEIRPAIPPAPQGDTNGYKRAVMELHYTPSYSVHRRLHHMYLQLLNEPRAALRRKENRYVDMKYEDDFTTQRRTITIVEDLLKNPAYAGQQALDAYDSERERQGQHYLSENTRNNPTRYQASPLVLSMLQLGEEAIAIRQGKPRPRIRTEREHVLARYTAGDETEQVVREMRYQRARRRNADGDVSLQGLREQHSFLPGIDEDESPPEYSR
ncbi:hypothetical protein HYFRA_00011436 [Hymenoscyphus fraxineus]|uniref:Uncharacterized protein n=1 Tax=Hymenoscyphus fraxineus TaxID=746836 RepID=A0A9N9PVP3_9HELO|nr:hypothetical protein HYFRA_00011436 [Hymenoscyphus fraxineus]